ncbi:ribosome biogenesis GTP-binding protein YihA/YsxC [Pantoea sp. Aalb]|uniref:ribosome biogenesis GTP-binding protein YihA/YsxC n=1 Tax=Pantoea sp. Aalb TaxID=2576762 RepID=UPI001323ACD8|nr:ribosome biogenesis GTP-binding protein YihA/YsxC [Pantoea sp. Aalb]MXP67959.1 YihA family ribosome biogenesis GTP-binding protein [Pantoea sp. Aalb]
MLTFNYHATHFMLSAPNIHFLPADIGIEIAFAGCSNVGKSRAINTLVNQKNLCYTSKLPGRTQLINLFEVMKGKRLVDLPGYGYAKVSKSMKFQWKYILTEYLQSRQTLKGLVILMDIRNPLKDLDNKIIKLAIQSNIQILLLLTKADKVNHNLRKIQLEIVRNKCLLEFRSDIQVEIFSSLNKIGLYQLSHKIDSWFCN